MKKKHCIQKVPTVKGGGERDGPMVGTRKGCPKGSKQREGSTAFGTGG